MKITLTGCKNTPSWTTLQSLINEATKNENGKLTRIRRVDNGVDYRANGEYDLTYRNNWSDPVNISLQIGD